MKIALSMIVKGTDDEAEVLGRCLGRTGSYVDGVFITITHKPGQQPSDKVRQVAEMFKANISEFEWCDDFAAARNFNFAQVPKEFDYIFWMDADDIPRNIEKLKPTIEEHKDVDCFSMMYLYAFDEENNPVIVHQKTRVIRNDGCVSWMGALHEDFTENRSVGRFFIKGIDILHLTDANRIEIAKGRNLQIAEKMQKDLPDDPRSYWNLANSLRSVNKYEQSTQVFEKFLEMSFSDEEKYIARLRIAENYLALKKFPEAQECVRYAIGIRPEYPDAYNLMGHVCFEMKQYERAGEYFKMGLVKPPPYYSIIVYNPRDYDYVPLMALAKVYFNLSLPMLALECLKACLKIYPHNDNLKHLVKLMSKESEEMEKILKLVKRLRTIKNKEKLKQELEKIPEKFQSHPAVQLIRNTHFVKTESSGKDVVFMCGYTKEEWNPESVKKTGIGGSEEAVINLSRELVKLGWKVTVYANCGYMETVYDGVVWKPYWTWNYRDKQDVLVIWRHPKLLDYDLNSSQIFLDMHDVIPPGEFNAARLKKITKIFVKSQAHREIFPNVPDEKFAVVPNGVDLSLFDQQVERDPHLLVNTSSPERSLDALVEMFGEVKKQVPEAKLKWAYGWRNFDSEHASEPAIMKWKDELVAKMKAAGVEDLGRISHEEVAKLYLSANVFAYPTEFYEIDCISARKAQLGGAVPVTTDFAALKETVQYGIKVHSEKTKDTWYKPYQFYFGLEEPRARELWINNCVQMLKNPLSEEGRKVMRDYPRQFAWDQIAIKWHEQFNRSR